MSATVTAPARVAPGSSASPTFWCPKVTVASASTQGLKSVLGASMQRDAAPLRRERGERVEFGILFANVAAFGQPEGAKALVRAAEETGAVLVLVPVMFIARQPDLGTAMLIFASGCYVLFLAGLSWRVIIALFIAAAACAAC